MYNEIFTQMASIMPNQPNNLLAGLATETIHAGMPNPEEVLGMIIAFGVFGIAAGAALWLFSRRGL